MLKSMKETRNASIVIPYHNEGLDFIKETIASIKSTIHSNYEIIIVDDLSDIPIIIEEENVVVIRNESNVGVGISFDNGVRIAKYDDLILMGADIRFENNRWAEMLIDEIQVHPKSIVCTACVNYKPNIPFANSKKYYGAKLLTRYLKINTIFEAQWILSDESIDSHEIPCILGACYSIKKDWYNYIDGWWGHMKWGTLEPYISLKSILMGGSCRVIPECETGHIFKEKTSNFHRVEQSNIIYNKLLVSSLLFTDKLRDILQGFIPNTRLKIKGQILIDKIQNELESKRSEYLKKIVYDEDVVQEMYDIYLDS